LISWLTINIAALRAAKDGAKAVSTHDLEFAREKIQGKSVVTSKELRKKIAYHESNHALVTIYTDGAYPVCEATIDPRGVSLGRVSHMPPDNDRTSPSRKQMLAKLDFYMGGRVAKELIFGQNGVTAGASSDLLKATTLARKMVTKYGMSTEVGPVRHNYLDNGRSMSSETRLLIEKEVKNLLERAYNNPAADVAEASGATTNSAEAGTCTAAKAQGVDAVEGAEVHNDQQGLPPIQPS
jgi:ATP-dependent metalloprotease